MIQKEIRFEHVDITKYPSRANTGKGYPFSKLLKVGDSFVVEFSKSMTVCTYRYNKLNPHLKLVTRVEFVDGVKYSRVIRIK